jgi:hypothetical protein
MLMETTNLTGVKFMIVSTSLKTNGELPTVILLIQNPTVNVQKKFVNAQLLGIVKISK